MFGFLAKECGWDKDFIAERFTLEQIERYYEVLNLQRRKWLREEAVVMSMATAYSSGNLKSKEWNNFLDSIYKGKNVDVNRTIKEMKDKGFNVEER